QRPFHSQPWLEVPRCHVPPDSGRPRRARLGAAAPPVDLELLVQRTALARPRQKPEPDEPNPNVLTTALYFGLSNLTSVLLLPASAARKGSGTSGRRRNFWRSRQVAAPTTG